MHRNLVQLLSDISNNYDVNTILQYPESDCIILEHVDVAVLSIRYYDLENCFRCTIMIQTDSVSFTFKGIEDFKIKYNQIFTKYTDLKSESLPRESFAKLIEEYTTEHNT